MARLEPNAPSPLGLVGLMATETSQGPMAPGGEIRTTVFDCAKLFAVRMRKINKHAKRNFIRAPLLKNNWLDSKETGAVRHRTASLVVFDMA